MARAKPMRLTVRDDELNEFPYFIFEASVAMPASVDHRTHRVVGPSEVHVLVKHSADSNLSVLFSVTSLRLPDTTATGAVSKGGHFAAWERPALFTTELRAAFKSLRELAIRDPGACDRCGLGRCLSARRLWRQGHFRAGHCPGQGFGAP
jgi:hypothetical protein